MEKRYSAVIINGECVNLKGYVLSKFPNKYGNIMFYSDKGKNPYRIVKPFEDIMYIENKKGDNK